MTAGDAAIRAVLNSVYDPCSVAANRPLGLVDMGLVLDWTLNDGALDVGICLTSGDCMMAPHFIEAARESLLALPGIETVAIVIDHDRQWTPQRMASRSAALERGDIVPYARRAGS